MGRDHYKLKRSPSAYLGLVRIPEPTSVKLQLPRTQRRRCFFHFHSQQQWSGVMYGCLKVTAVNPVDSSLAPVELAQGSCLFLASARFSLFKNWIPAASRTPAKPFNAALVKDLKKWGLIWMNSFRHNYVYHCTLTCLYIINPKRELLMFCVSYNMNAKVTRPCHMQQSVTQIALCLLVVTLKYRIEV